MDLNAFHHTAKQPPDSPTALESMILFGQLKDDAEGAFRTGAAAFQTSVFKRFPHLKYHLRGLLLHLWNNFHIASIFNIIATPKNHNIICTQRYLKKSSFNIQEDCTFLFRYLKATLTKQICFICTVFQEDWKEKKQLNCTLRKKTGFFIFLESIQIYTKKNLSKIYPRKINIFTQCGLNILILSSSTYL